MANKGANTNGRVYFIVLVCCLLTNICSSQFYLTFKAAAHLDKKHTVFGKLVGGEEVLDALESLPVKPGTDRPAKIVLITEVVMSVTPFLQRGVLSSNIFHLSYQDPFEDYKTRLAKKLAKRAEGETRGPVEEKKDEVNWFGVKVGSNNSALTLGEKGSGGVGKYLSLKRPQSSMETTAADDVKKKRRIGFGNFEGW